MEHPHYNDLPGDTRIDVERITERYNTEYTEVTVGRKAPGDGVQFRLELYSHGKLRDSTMWMEPAQFRYFVGGLTTAHRWEKRVHTDP